MNNETQSKIGIGTARFGLNYGITNPNTSTSETEAHQIALRAAEVGCLTIDTAASYGNSEEVLGRILPKHVQFKIITKTLPVLNRSIDTPLLQQFQSNFLLSLKKLARPNIEGLLIHHGVDLLKTDGKKLFALLESLRDAGYTKKIGVSVYDSAEITAILKRYKIDIVQLPLNVLDQRLLLDGTIDRLRDHGIDIHIRSVFLQGLLLQPLNNIPKYFNPILPNLHAWHQRLKANGRAAIDGALSFACNLQKIEKVIVGLDTTQQLEQLLLADSSPLSFPISDISCSNPSFVNPAMWQLVQP
jgi:aryl-alcohol dehydrogenase-like predicted oxidoreductase